MCCFWKSSQPNLARSGSSIPKAEIPAHDGPIHETSRPTYLPAGPNVSQFQADLPPAPSSGRLSATGPVMDNITNAVRDGSDRTNTSQQLDDAGDTVATSQNNVSSNVSTAFNGVTSVSPTSSPEKGGPSKPRWEMHGDDEPVEDSCLMKVLDGLQSVHPFIGVVVLAFKAVHTLWRYYRNEKKVTFLSNEMKDMMSVLVRLKDVQPVAPDGKTIEDRLRSLTERTAGDIKHCANVCDTYMKRRFLAKVVLCPFWDDEFVKLVKRFRQRRQEFVHELSIHISLKANVQLDPIGDATKALDPNLDDVKHMLHGMVTPEHKRVWELVVEKGGTKAVRDSDKTLREVAKFADEMSSASCAEGHRMRRGIPEDPHPNEGDLRSDIFEDPDVAVQKNSAEFFRKFEAQMNQIVKDVTTVVERAGDRVVRELRGSSHERIQDPSIREMWKDMGWRGSVKARHFVLALQDHFQDMLPSESEDMFDMGVDAMNSSPNSHTWALQFVNLTRLQPILEAIDGDTSGFITIAEVNRFTSSRPDDWSLPYWVAFWAIDRTFVRQDGRYSSRGAPSQSEVYRLLLRPRLEPIHTLTAAVLPLRHVSTDVEIFRAYLEAEEARLSNNLKEVDYVIDGTVILSRIKGVGRIEKTLFPLLYLLMKRHYEIMRIMQTKILHSHYFFEQKLDIEKKFQNFAYGIFKYFHNGKALWSTDYVWSLNPSPAFIPYNDANEDPNVKPEDILKHEHSEEVALEDWVYDGHSTDDIPKYGDVESPLRDILGHWHGYFYEVDGIRETKGTDTMMTFVLEPADGEQNFKAKACGHFDPGRDALTGVWDLSAGRNHTAGPMEFRRILPRYLTVYPSIKELSDNKPRALWRFAITARRDDRETVISLMLRYLHHGTPLQEEEIQRMCTAAQRLTSADACFYGSRINHIRAHTWVHGGLIGGARLFCLECAHKSTEAYIPLNLCCKPECISQRITHRQDLEGEHEPNHKLVKVRASLLKRQEGRVRTAAHAAFKRVEETCKKIARLSRESQEKEKIRRDAKNASSLEQPFTEMLSTSDNHDELGPRGGIEGGAKDVWDTSDGSEDEGSQDPIQAPGMLQTQDSDLPTCGKCYGPLSFPCWYCIVCEGGAHKLTRSSGMHFDRHPLIRCLTPEMDDDITSATEQRLVFMEDRLSDMQTRFDGLSDRFDDLSSRFDGRFCNIEQLLHRLVVAAGNSA
ncbi:hypothetical protein BJV78DRAFT_1155917 [Lactifluus subvellereus]|nr:hypothetical protein BJV78DRAFT_1155917 [Lactifluus subvellereus]